MARRKRTVKKQMTIREQAVAILRVAKLSFKTAPGAVTFKLVGAIVEAVLPLATAYFAALTATLLFEAYNGVAAARDQVIWYVLVTSGLGLISMVWRSIDQYIQASMRYVIEAKVSDQMYEQFLGLDFWRYDDKETVDLYDKAQKFAQFFAWIFDRFASVMSQLIAMLAGIAALGFVNVWLALAVLVAIFPTVYIQFKLSRLQIAHWNSNVETRRTKSLIEWDLLQPKVITELRLYGMVRHLLNLRTKLRDKDEKTRLDYERKYIVKRLLADGLQVVAEFGALFWVTLEIVAKRLPVGQFIYVQQVVSRVIASATGFINELSTIDEDVANLFDYERFMQLEKTVSQQHKVLASPEKLVFDHVTFYYPGSATKVLDDVSLTITKKQHVAIVGENGAGKTTLIKLLAGIYAPADGKVMLDGSSLQKFDISSWHQQLAVLRQDFTQYTFANARDNVLFGDINKRDDSSLQRALVDAEAKQFTDKLPQKLNTFLSNWIEDEAGNKGVDLSGGQWQRLALARNFYRDSPIIILDEPTSAIDALAESRIFDKLFKESSKTIIAISHRLTTVKKADIIYMMKDGKVVETGTYEELVAKHGEFYEMFKSQL